MLKFIFGALVAFILVGYDVVTVDYIRQALDAVANSLAALIQTTKE